MDLVEAGAPSAVGEDVDGEGVGDELAVAAVADAELDAADEGPGGGARGLGGTG